MYQVNIVFPEDRPEHPTAMIQVDYPMPKVRNNGYGVFGGYPLIQVSGDDAHKMGIGITGEVTHSDGSVFFGNMLRAMYRKDGFYYSIS